MEIVERVRLLCKEKGIAISKMEKDLGYGNGYFNPKKLRAIPSSRLKEIAEYLDVSVNELLGENDKEYYFDPDTIRMAQQIYEDKELRALFDAARGADPEALQAAQAMLKVLKRKERGS